jgi:NADP-dependent 3-hydroxy acid dehydrogenase YdfG
MTKNIKTNLIVVLGSESGVIKPVIESLSSETKIIRIFNQAVPQPLANCIDVHGLVELASCLDDFEFGPDEQKISFIGAAFSRQASLFVNETADSLKRMIDVNINLYIEALSILLPRMIHAKFGRLIYLSSFRATNPIKGTTIYSASKAFGESLFSGIGKEYGRFNISASTIRMGFFDAGMMDDYQEEAKSKAKQSISLNRLGASSDLESAITFCLDNPYLSSGVIELNGGLNLG